MVEGRAELRAAAREIDLANIVWARGYRRTTGQLSCDSTPELRTTGAWNDGERCEAGAERERERRWLIEGFTMESEEVVRSWFEGGSPASGRD